MGKKDKTHMLEKDGLVSKFYTILWHKSPVFGKSYHYLYTSNLYSS